MKWSGNQTAFCLYATAVAAAAAASFLEQKCLQFGDSKSNLTLCPSKVGNDFAVYHGER